MSQRRERPSGARSEWSHFARVLFLPVIHDLFPRAGRETVRCCAREQDGPFRGRLCMGRAPFGHPCTAHEVSFFERFAFAVRMHRWHRRQARA